MREGTVNLRIDVSVFTHSATNKATIALANKLAPTVWAVWTPDPAYETD